MGLVRAFIIAAAGFMLDSKASAWKKRVRADHCSKILFTTDSSESHILLDQHELLCDNQHSQMLEIPET